MNGVITEATNEIVAATAQQPFLLEHFDAIITVAITVIGFVVTYLMTKKNFSDEIKKDKINRAMEVIQSLPYDICQLMDKMIKDRGIKQDVLLKEYGEMLSKVLAYGSKDAVKIVTKMQQMSYQADGKTTTERLPMLATYSLLITQLKYDLTAEIISPESWFQLRMNDYASIQNTMKKAINALVEELDLNHSFSV